MKIKIFGKLTDIFQKEEYTMNKVLTTTELRKHLEEVFPKLRSYSYLLVVNNEIVQEEIILDINAEIALLPPYSGG